MKVGKGGLVSHHNSCLPKWEIVLALRYVNFKRTAMATVIYETWGKTLNRKGVNAIGD